MKFMMMINVPACASRSVFRVVLLLSCVGMATPVRAQMAVSPSGGISGEGQPTVGAAVGMSLGVVRPELELAWARRGIDRRAATPSEPHRNVHDANGPVYLPVGDGRRIHTDVPRGGSAQAWQEVRAIWQRRCGSRASHTPTATRGVVAADRHPGRHRSGRGRNHLAQQQNWAPDGGHVLQSPRA